jgi:hypothetical protein
LPNLSAFLWTSPDTLSAASLASSDCPDTKLPTSVAAPWTLSLAAEAVSFTLSAADSDAFFMLSVTLSSARTVRGRTLGDLITLLVLLALWLTFKRKPPRVQDVEELSLAALLLLWLDIVAGDDPATTKLTCTAKAFTAAIFNLDAHGKEKIKWVLL